MDQEQLAAVLKSHSCANYLFPTAESVPLLTPQETVLLKEFDWSIAFASAPEPPHFDCFDWYGIVILGLRGVLASVRNGSPVESLPLRVLLWALPRIDMPDGIRALLVLEECCKRGDRSMEECIAEFDADAVVAAGVGSARSYLKRSADWRTLQTGGITRIGDGPTLQFRA